MLSYKIDEETMLRLNQERNAEESYALIDRNREHLRLWLPWAVDEFSLEDTRNYIKRNLQQFADGKGYSLSIIYRGEMAGQVGFNAIDWVNRKAELGYWLGASFQGKGLMTKACRELINNAFHEMSLNRMEIHCGIENKRSRVIPERLGFSMEGTLRQAEWLHHRFHDLAVYGLLASEWAVLDGSTSTQPEHGGK